MATDNPMMDEAETDLGHRLEALYYRNLDVDMNFLLDEIAVHYVSQSGVDAEYQGSPEVFLDDEDFTVSRREGENFSVEGENIEVFYDRIRTDNSFWRASIEYERNEPFPQWDTRDQALRDHLRQRFDSRITDDYYRIEPAVGD